MKETMTDKKTVQAHARIVHDFTRRVFTGELKPGDRLPSEKKLQEELDVDRGGLRTALKQLESTGVLEIRQGDGMYVKDYVKNAGIDFLRVLFLHDTDPENLILDETIIDEIAEFWLILLPAMLETAVSRYTSRDVKAALELFKECEAFLDDRAQLVDLIVLSQDMVAEMVNNTVLLLLFNSSRPLRRKLTEISLQYLDWKEIEDLISLEMDLYRTVQGGTREEASQCITKIVDKLQSFRGEIRKALMKRVT